MVRIDPGRGNQEFQTTISPALERLGIHHTLAHVASATTAFAATLLSIRPTFSLATLQGDTTDGERGSHYPDVESRTAPSQERSLLRAFVVAVKWAFASLCPGSIDYRPDLRRALLP